MINYEKLRPKRDAILILSQSLGLHVDDLPYMYPDDVFDRHLTRQLASQAIKLNISEFNEKRLNEICNIPFNRDNRSAAEYGVDLIYGWLVEDLVIEFLLMKKLKVRRIGADREREFLSARQIKSDLDIEIKFGNKTKQFDIYFDSQNYWQKNNKMDVRESKWKELEKENASIIAVSNTGFGIIDSATEHIFGRNPLWGGKNCATIFEIKDKLVSPNDFVALLKNKMKEEA